MKSNLYKKFNKNNQSKSREYRKTNLIKLTFDFILKCIDRLSKIIWYIVIVALSSVGATIIFRYIVERGIV